MVSSLPSEMLLRIFSYLPELKDLCSCSCVCRKWRELLDDDSCVWENKLHELRLECPKLADDHLLDTMPSPKAKLVAYCCRWNDDDRSKNIYIKENKLTLHRNPVAQSSDAIRGKVGFTSGVHYWVVIWHGPKLGSTAVVGVATKEARLQDNGYYPLIGCDKDSWGWDIPTCQLRHSGQEVQRYPKDSDYKVCSTPCKPDKFALRWWLHNYYTVCSSCCSDAHTSSLFNQPTPIVRESYYFITEGV